MNTIYVGITGLIGYFIAGALIKACGSKNILSMTRRHDFFLILNIQHIQHTLNKLILEFSLKQ